MPAPTDRNDRIALAKGWRRACYRQRTPHPNRCEKELGPWCKTCPLNFWEEWIDPAGKPAIRPDYVGTLKGVSEMLRELYEATDKVHEVVFIPFDDGLQCCLATKSGDRRYFLSSWERLGDCVGYAYISVFEKEAVDVD